MKGVKFNVSTTPFGKGDTALLPDHVADTLVGSGEADAYDFPQNPHAHETVYQPAVTKPVVPTNRDRKIPFKTK